uniref:Zinc finger PHD-type domain-containing protein n=1 Tax=Salmo trutta TaxID=8032 RepID=A0A673YU93_SALTR
RTPEIHEQHQPQSGWTNHNSCPTDNKTHPLTDPKRDHDCKLPQSSLTQFFPEATPNEDDSWDLITCFCLKPFAGRPMIECSECGTWVHLSCAKIRRTHVPEVFICQPCRDTKTNIRRSNRARIAPRKRFSD